MGLTRRQMLQAGAAAGGMVVLRPAGVLAQQLPSIDGYGTARESRLFPGEFCVHADMHNHSLFSDGDGQPSNYFDLMRTSGVDVAALTDHSVIDDLAPMSPCGTFTPGQDHYKEENANEVSKGCQGIAGLDESSWVALKDLAAGANKDRDFTAIAGFEWSSPTLGHINVWFSREFTDPLHTGGLGGLDDLLEYARVEGFPVPPDAVDAARDILNNVPAAGDGISGFYNWLKSDPSTPPLGGGADAIFGFNHPGREPSRYENFKLDPALVDRAVSMELFNKGSDYLFERTDAGRASPLIACLDAGWRPGILGTSDYHGTDWGTPDDLGRAGMYVTSLSRSTVRAAMTRRRFFATRIKGLRLDATANGSRMGQTLGHRTGRVTFRVDIDRGAAWYGKKINVQVLATGSLLPTVLDNIEVAIPTARQPVIEFDLPIDVGEQGRWTVLRFTDPDGKAEESDPDGTFTGFGRSFAYASPFYLDPDAAPGAVDPTRGERGGKNPGAGSPGGRGRGGGGGSGVSPTARELPATGGGSLGIIGGAAAAALGGLISLRTRSAHHHHDAE